MWVQAGFSPELFWDQTPRHFQLAMRGVRKRRESEADRLTAQAWQAGAFSGLAQAGKLKPMKHYLGRTDKAQRPKEMLAALLAYQANGAKMTIRRIGG